MVEIIKTIKINIKSEMFDYLDSNIEIASFFNRETSSANISGIIIVKRYYDKKTNTSFSLAVLKIK